MRALADAFNQERLWLWNLREPSFNLRLKLLSKSDTSAGYRIKRWLGVRRSTWLLSLYILAYFVYLLGGCLLFACLEQEVETDIKVGNRVFSGNKKPSAWEYQWKSSPHHPGLRNHLYSFFCCRGKCLNFVQFLSLFLPNVLRWNYLQEIT